MADSREEKLNRFQLVRPSCKSPQKTTTLLVWRKLSDDLYRSCPIASCPSDRVNADAHLTLTTLSAAVESSPSDRECHIDFEFDYICTSPGGEFYQQAHARSEMSRQRWHSTPAVLGPPAPAAAHSRAPRRAGPRLICCQVLATCAGDADLSRRRGFIGPVHSVQRRVASSIDR